MLADEYGALAAEDHAVARVSFLCSWRFN